MMFHLNPIYNVIWCGKYLKNDEVSAPKILNVMLSLFIIGGIKCAVTSQFNITPRYIQTPAVICDDLDYRDRQFFFWKTRYSDG